MPYSKLWKVVYFFYPPVLRILEKVRIHKDRQKFLLGHLKNSQDLTQLKEELIKEGFEPVILAWRDSGEILSLRKVDRKKYQYHLRVYSDLEVRGHYEYSSEGNPWGHVFEKCFEPRKEFFEKWLEGKLKELPSHT